MTGTGPIKLCLTLSSDEGKPKVVARVYSNGDPIDPSKLSWWQVQRLAMSKAWDTWATEPRTVYQAGLLMFKKGLSVFTVPEPLKNSISRKAKDHEVMIEGVFRQWLKNVVENAKTGLEVKYMASGIPGATTETLRSTAAKDEQAEEIAVVDVRVLTPLFYARMVRYGSVEKALEEEARQGQVLEVEGLDELLISAQDVRPIVAMKRGFVEKIRGTAISLLQKAPNSLHSAARLQTSVPLSNSNATFRKAGFKATTKSITMNGSSSVITDADELNAYQVAVLKVLLSDWLAMGNMDLLAIERSIIRIGLIWMVGSGLQNVLHELLAQMSGDAEECSRLWSRRSDENKLLVR